MQQIRIICKCGYEWETLINNKVSISAAKRYFLNMPFNVGNDNNEKIVYPMQVLFKGLDY